MHLYVVLCDPFGTPPQIIAVSITSADEDTETTVILNEGDHAFIKQPTSVDYHRAAFMDCEQLSALEEINKGRDYRDVIFRTHQPMRSDVLNLIIQGLYKSERAQKKIKKALQDQLGDVPPESDAIRSI